jgi:hypothetical protein
MEVDPELYSILLQPSRTRSALPPIKNIPIEKRRLTREAILNPSNCVFNLQGFSSSSIYDADSDAGKYYYIHIDPYDSLPLTKRVIDEVSPLLINPIEFEPSAFYTYIVASIIGKDKKTNNTITLSPIQLYATKTINMYEFGTKHHQIFYRIAIRDEALFVELAKIYNKIEYRLYVAGEIMCINKNTLVFNFFSGTYKMKRHISNRHIKYEAAYIMYMVQETAPNYTNIRFQKCPLITNEVLPLTKKELSRLRNHNISMVLFDTPNQCKYMRGALIRYKNENKKDFISYDDLQKISKPLMDKPIKWINL